MSQPSTRFKLDICNKFSSITSYTCRILSCAMFTEEKEKCSFHDVKITLVNIQYGIFVESVKSYVDLCNLNLQFYLFLIIFYGETL